jgi:hypothetical protein
MSTSPPKKRGAQPANTNALKHGVYSRHYTPEELLALDKDVAGSLKDELEILRLSIFDAAESVLKEPEDSLSFHDNVTALRTITVAVARLENIIQVRMTVFGDPDQREKQVESMLALMEQSEMKALEHLPSSSTTPGTLPKYSVFREGWGRAGIGPVDKTAPRCAEEAGEGLGVEAESAEGSKQFHGVGHTGVGPLPHPLKKKRGGQPGNSNSYKHGFYASVLSSSQKSLLQGDEADQLRHEETLLRVLTRRTWRSMRRVRSTIPWQEYLFTVRTIGYAVFVIAKLQRARRRFFGDKTDLEKDIQLGLSEACADLGILDYFHAQVEK